MVKKKKFTREIKGIDALFSGDSSEQDTTEKVQKVEGGKVAAQVRKKSKPSLEKISFNLDAETCEKVKAFAFDKRTSTTKILEKCVEDYFSKIPEQEIVQSLEIYRKSKI